METHMELRAALEAELAHLPLPEFDSTPWVTPPDLKEARVALISSAAIHRRSDRKFGFAPSDYRIIPGDVDYAEIVMSHVSVNFDRSGFQQDVNVVFPLQHLHALAAAGEIGSVAAWHYAFSGAPDPAVLKDAAQEIARLLKGDGVTAALLVPV